MMTKRKKIIKEYILITIAVILMDIGVYVFKFPNNFSFGGVSGLAVVVP
ncbi:MAG: YitT family protein, partial [Lachnospiraceae bacterium]|nr:YitT family protein [Lachnospiraceae bacterium]